MLDKRQDLGGAAPKPPQTLKSLIKLLFSACFASFASFAFFVSFVFFASFALSGCFVDSVSAPPELLLPQSAQVLDRAFVSRGTIKELSRHSGIIRTRSEALHFGRTTYYFDAHHVRSGDRVYEGQLLATLDQRGLREEAEELERHILYRRRLDSIENELTALEIEALALEYAQALLLAADAFDEAAMLEAERLGHMIDRMEMDLRLRQERQLFDLREDEERLRQLSLQMRDFEVRAPYEGIITYIEFMGPNQWVPALEPVIFIACLEAETIIDYFGHLPGPARTVRVQAHINNQVYDLLPVNIAAAEWRSYIAHGGPIPRRFQVAYGEGLPLGAYAAIHVYTQWNEDALRIPVNALLSSQEMGYYVYQMQAGQLIAREINIGIRTDAFVEVLTGLEEGDEVIVRP